MPCIFAEKWYLIFNDLRTVIFMGFVCSETVLFLRFFETFFDSSL